MSTGLGLLFQPGHPQHAHAVHGVVGLRDWELTEWSVWGQVVMAGVNMGPFQEHSVSCLSLPGILGMVELGAQSVVYELTVILYMVSEWEPVMGRC